MQPEAEASPGMDIPQLFPDADAGGAARGPRELPVLDVQKDIHYHAVDARSILNAPAATGMPFWSINPYVGCAFGCAYCYARFTHRYTMERATGGAAGAESWVSTGDDGAALPPWLAFERQVLVKREAAQLLRAELRPGRRAYEALVERGEPLVIGTATDPYQPAERRFQITRALLGVLGEHAGMQVGLITKSPLVTRDAALLAAISARSRLTVHISLITLDRALARRVEPRAPTPESRLRAVRRLREAGVDVGVNCMPVLPGLTDQPSALRALVAAVANAGATHLNVGSLRLRAAARQRYLPWVSENVPELSARYQATYATSAQPSERYRAGLRSFISRLCAEYGLAANVGGGQRGDASPAARALARATHALSAQLQLAL